MRSWERRLTQFDRDLETEPGSHRRLLRGPRERIEPVGLVYLWPDTN